MFIKGNSIVSKIIFISAIPLLIYGLAFCGLSSLTKWQVHKYVSAEEKESAAQAALMPQVAEYVERQGLNRQSEAFFGQDISSSLGFQPDRF